MDYKVNVEKLDKPEEVALLTESISELAELLDVLVLDASPDGSVEARLGRIGIFGTQVWINTDGDTAWTRIDAASTDASKWEVDGTEHQLKTADEIDMQSKKIINVTDPANDQDAATKKHVADAITAAIATADEKLQGWISFDGSGVIAENDSFNVSSITDEGTGDYTVTWDTDFANTDYAVTALGRRASSGPDGTICLHAVPTVGAARFVCTVASNGAAEDFSVVMVIASGDQ